MNLNYVRFDVGHYLYVCHKNTIDKFPSSVLAKYVSPEFDKRQNGMDYIVIDRDGKHFGSILNYMRDQTSLDLSGWDDNDLTDLMREADFYCLTDLVEYCEHEFEVRDAHRRHSEAIAEPKQTLASSSSSSAPPNCKLEVVFGLSVMEALLESSKKQTIVISYQNMRRFHIDSWIEELVKLCDHNKFNVYCFADRGEETICSQTGNSLNSKGFIVALYEPLVEKFTSWLKAPAYDKFRAHRAHYKCKIFKFWFLVQNDLAHTIKKRL